MSKRSLKVRLGNICLCVLACMMRLPGGTELTIEIKDYATMPITGAVDGAGNSAGLLARINFLREEPAEAENGSSSMT